MFNSNITVKSIIETVNNEIDLAITIGNDSYVRWINELEQKLYSEIIKERKEDVISFPENPIDLSVEIVVSGDESTVRFEDVVMVYADDVELTKTNVGNVLYNTYYKVGNDLCFNRKGVSELKVIYNVRPKVKTVANYATEKFMLPVEFLELVTSKLRGEAYKLANEDDFAAKWLNDYNVHLETFKTWVADKQAKFGV